MGELVVPHRTENSKHILLEMKPRGLVLNFTIMYLGAIYLFPCTIGLIWNLVFPAKEPRVHISDQHINIQFGKLWDHKWKQLILAVNFLFGLRVNEIPNKTFIFDSHWPFICTAVYSKGFFLVGNFCKVALHVVGPHLDTRIFEAMSCGLCS